MSTMVTRCPQCRTPFRVTEEHLKIANGAVRCGSCLLVFQARDHWVNAEPPAASAASSSTKENPLAATGKFQFDQAAIDNSHASASSNKTSIPADNGLPAKPFDLRAAIGKLPSEETTVTSSSPEQKKLEDIGDDEKISDDFGLEDDEEPVIIPKKTTPAAQTDFGDPDDDYSSVFDDVAEQHATTGHALDDFIDIDALASDESDLNPIKEEPVSDDAWAKQMLDEMEQEAKPAGVDLGKVEHIREALTDFTNPVDVDAARRDLGFDRPDPFAAQDLGKSRHGDGRAHMIAHIEPPPVDLHSTRANRAVALKSLLIWNSAIAALLVLLLAQYVFFNFDRLAKSSTSRPYIQTVCHVFGCTLPAVENWRYIKIQNLVVRKHPQIANVLSVDAILLNVTNQELLFPKLELYFSDLLKLPVASRRFEPAEYLSGELSGQTIMPPGRPVHIAFDVINPGDNAVNWVMQVAGKTE